MNRKRIIIGVILAVILGGFIYRFTHLETGTDGHTDKKETAYKEEKAGGHDEGKEHKEKKEEHGDHEEDEEFDHIKMTAEMQKQNGVVIGEAKKQRLGGVISVTGKVAANADRIAHVSPRIPGKIIAVRASLGDSVSNGQPLVTLDSVEMGESLNRYHQSKTRLQLAKNRLDRVMTLSDKKIIARKDVFQAESDYQIAEAEFHNDEERLSLYGVSVADLKNGSHKKPVLTVRSPINGVITEKQAVVGELSDPSKSLYTIADLSSVWILVDINEKDLSKVRKGQSATVAVGAFPDLKLKGRITHIADLVNEATRTIKARIEVVNPGRKLKPEMFATVELALPSDTPSTLAVPEEALQDLDGKKVVFVAENETEFAARQVQAGRTALGMVEIVSGLKEGENYAIKGSFILKSEVKKGEMTDEHGHGK